jgi:hypothetical protein
MLSLLLMLSQICYCHCFETVTTADAVTIFEVVTIVYAATGYAVTAIASVTMRLCHPPNGSTSPKYKLLGFKPP